jgi:hypothetical protein
VPKVQVKEENDDDSAAAAHMTDLDDAEGGELFRAIEEARSTNGAEVILTRTMPADKAGFCDKIPVAEFDLTMLKNKYGAGTYRVRFNGPKGFLPGGSTIKIATSPERPSVSASDPMTFLEIMEKREAERRARSDDWIKLLVSSCVPLITAFIARPQSNDMASLVTALKPAPGPTLADMSSTLVSLQTLSGGNKQESQVDMILKVFESAQSLMSGDSDKGNKEGSNWVDVIRDLIKAAPDAIKPMLEARMTAMQSKVSSVRQSPLVTASAIPSQPLTPMQPVPSADQPESHAPLAENTGDNMRAMWEPIAKLHLAKIVAWAEKNRDPEIYGEVWMDELPPLGEYLSVDQVIEHLKNPVWFEKVCELEPRLKNHAEYTKEFHDVVLEICEDLKKESEETQQPEQSDTKTE